MPGRALRRGEGFKRHGEQGLGALADAFGAGVGLGQHVGEVGAGGVLLGLAECAAEACFCTAGGKEVLRQGGHAESKGGLLQIGGGVEGGGS